MIAVLESTNWLNKLNSSGFYSLSSSVFSVGVVSVHLRYNVKTDWPLKCRDQQKSLILGQSFFMW
jgi:hypothetical protein